MRKHINRFVLLIPFITIMVPFNMIMHSCVSVEKVASRISVDSLEIPAAMKYDEFVLIGKLDGRRPYDKTVKKEFSHYTGEYVLATEAQLKDEYWDVNKYRFLMYFSREYNYDHMSRTNLQTFRYYIEDRKLRLTYYRKTRSSAYHKEMRAYLMAIERIRFKSGG